MLLCTSELQVPLAVHCSAAAFVRQPPSASHCTHATAFLRHFHECALQRQTPQRKCDARHLGHPVKRWRTGGVATGIRRTAKLRQRYLAAALTHEIAYYDTTQTSGAIIDGLTVDCAAVQAATSERIGHTINNLTQFLLGLAVGFVRGWKLSLVMIAIFPVMAAAGAIMAKAATAGEAQSAEAYAAANVAAAQTIANMRTVAAFQAEQPLLQRYTEMLAYPKRVSIRMSVLTGTANGSINAAMFFTCASTPPPRMISPAFSPALSASAAHPPEGRASVAAVAAIGCCSDAVDTL